MSALTKIRLAINYIEENLAEKLDLMNIAAETDFSPYHLHRIFSQVTGITIHNYLRRRQLTEAAKLLAFSDMPIIEISMTAGYESQQAFNRIFTAIYKYSPKVFRNKQMFYPLQLPYHGLTDSALEIMTGKNIRLAVGFASENDFAGWMQLVRLVIDGYPLLDETEHILALKKAVAHNQALIVKHGETAVGNMIFSYTSGNIDFLGIHPLYRKMGIAELLLDKIAHDLPVGNDKISITTYRKGDKADTGQRKALKQLGFMESEILTEFGYPTQKFVSFKNALHK